MTQATKKIAAGASDKEPSWQDRLRAIIEQCADIPAQVRAANFARLDERVLDDALFRFLTEHHPAGPSDEARTAAMRRRAEDLAPYRGRKLVCVLITLPGVRYTIEVDPEEECVVHWEWQSG